MHVHQHRRRARDERATIFSFHCLSDAGRPERRYFRDAMNVDAHEFRNKILEAREALTKQDDADQIKRGIDTTVMQEEEDPVEDEPERIAPVQAPAGVAGGAFGSGFAETLVMTLTLSSTSSTPRRRSRRRCGTSTDSASRPRTPTTKTPSSGPRSSDAARCSTTS